MLAAIIPGMHPRAFLCAALSSRSLCFEQVRLSFVPPEFQVQSHTRNNNGTLILVLLNGLTCGSNNSSREKSTVELGRELVSSEMWKGTAAELIWITFLALNFEKDSSA